MQQTSGKLCVLCLSRYGSAFGTWKYRQMEFQSVDGAVVASFLEPLGQTKVMHSRQIEKFLLICFLKGMKHQYKFIHVNR